MAYVKPLQESSNADLNDLQQYCGPLFCVYLFPSHGGKPRRSSILTCIAGEIEEQGCWNKFSGNQRGGGFMKGKFVIHLKTAVCCWKPQPGGWRTIYSRIYSASAYNQQSPKKKKRNESTSLHNYLFKAMFNSTHNASQCICCHKAELQKLLFCFACSAINGFTAALCWSPMQLHDNEHIAAKTHLKAKFAH